MNNRLGWVRVAADDLSEFHHVLIKTIPKYASIAVSEMMLPANREVLPIEERALLPKCRDCGVGKCDEIPEAAPGTFLTNEQLRALEGEGEGSKNLADAVEHAVRELPSFQEMLKRRVAKSEPVVYKQPLRKPRELSSPVLTLDGVAGTSKYLEWRPECLFRAKQVEISDTLFGEGTAVGYMMVGCRVQTMLPFASLNSSMLTVEAMRRLLPLNEDPKWHLDTGQPVFSISIHVTFLKDCQFKMMIKGKALI